MASSRIIELTKELTRPIVDALAFELVDVEYIKEGPNWYLRIYIDKPGGITIDDCEIVSSRVSEKLDELDPISRQYFLEVSSPGIDRPLKTDRDFEKSLGQQVEIKLYQPLNGSKIIEGKLVGYNSQEIIISDKNNAEIVLDLQKVAIIKRAIIF